MSKSAGIGPLSLLGIVFVTLKLCGVIAWSWWWVTAPFWAIPVIALAAIAAAFVLALLSEVIRLHGIKRRPKKLEIDRSRLDSSAREYVPPPERGAPSKEYSWAFHTPSDPEIEAKRKAFFDKMQKDKP